MLGRIGAFLLDILQVVVFAGAIFLVLYLLVTQPHKIKGLSMFPNFHDGEYLLTDKISYRFGQPKRGDVVIFRAPGTNTDDFIKRVIGVPGDRVVLKEQKVFINDSLLNESYIPSDFETNPGTFLAQNTEVTVPQGQYFVLGDNRSHSADSRIFGFVEKSRIIGRAFFMYWPLDRLGLIKGASY